ncbi:hypothetical protein LCGC14_2079910 [marine sediment metagenome]|uniref:SiaC family regulatory phosphoprotein domain-containing protein n=1 Tax=marine sediment metagenome TaxID=412755 RepID=A0A0F9EFS3_9ZZZZ
MAFQVEKTPTTPQVYIDQGEIKIEGRSIPEDSFEFFEPVIDACRKYIEKPAKHTIVSIHLEYVNSGSKKYLTNILTILEKSYLDGNGYEVAWTYDSDDEAMLDLGNDLKGIIKIPISIKVS